MTRQEIADLLELVIANYPKAFIKDAKATLSVWEMAFGEEPAERVYRAARHHMDISKDFPTIADIKDCMNKGEMIYGGDNQPKIAPTAPNKLIKAEDEKCKYEKCVLYHDLCNGLDENNECPFEGL